ncbi:CRISPR-associated endonuclease Cas1 [Streptomyces noursei]|uniref:CRISPR-associated endonuclease Cas1 n=1 Tax=Streptomyces noursei TaxID=1971 RepID=UPI0035D9579C
MSYYGDYAGSLLTSDTSTSGETVPAQAQLTGSPAVRLEIARTIVDSCAFNVRRSSDRKLLARPYSVLQSTLRTADSTAHLMGAEGTFRRSAWEVLDIKLPTWLQLGGRSRRPPRNAANAFISYVNGITYARFLTALRLTPLHTGIAFLNSSIERQQHSLVPDLSEMFKPLFAERLLLRMANRNQLKEHHFDRDTNQAMLSESGRKLDVQAARGEFEVTIAHRSLDRLVAYDELLYLDALAHTHRCLEGTPYKPFRIWW